VGTIGTILLIEKKDRLNGRLIKKEAKSGINTMGSKKGGQGVWMQQWLWAVLL